MQRSEEDYLVLEKTNNGKSKKQAYQEIKNLELSQIKFKKLENKLKSKDKQIEKLNNQITRLQRRNFSLLPNSEKKSKEIKNIKTDEEIIKALDRVFCLLNSEKRVGLTDLEKTTHVNSELCKKILSLLIRNNLAREVKEVNNKFNTLYLERI